MKKILSFWLFTIFVSSSAQAIMGQGCTGNPDHPDEISIADYNALPFKDQSQCVEVGQGIFPHTNAYYCCKENNI